MRQTNPLLFRSFTFALALLLAQGAASAMVCASVVDCAMERPDTAPSPSARPACHGMEMESDGAASVGDEGVRRAAEGVACCAIVAPAAASAAHDPTPRVVFATIPAIAGLAADRARSFSVVAAVEPRARASGRALRAEHQSFLL